MRDVGSEKDEDEMTDKHMTTASQHYFVDESDKSSFSIAIIEVLLFLRKLSKTKNVRSLFLLYFIYWFVCLLFAIADQNMKEEYGLFVWPCSVILADYVWQQRYRFSGANVVEAYAIPILIQLIINQ